MKKSLTKKSLFTQALMATGFGVLALSLTACDPKASDDTQTSDTPAQVSDMHNEMAGDHAKNETASHIEDHEMGEHSQHNTNSDHMASHSAYESSNEVTQAYMQGMSKMHDDMMAGMQANDADVAFAKGMLPHHEGAVAMAEVQLKYGKDEQMLKLAEDIIKAQQSEIEQMQQWITANPDSSEQPYTKQMQQKLHQSMQSMHSEMMTGIASPDADLAFAKGMLPHHQGAVAMAEIELKYGKNDEMRKLAQDIINAQQGEIELMQNWIKAHS